MCKSASFHVHLPTAVRSMKIPPTPEGLMGEEITERLLLQDCLVSSANECFLGNLGRWELEPLVHSQRERPKLLELPLEGCILSCMYRAKHSNDNKWPRSCCHNLASREVSSRNNSFNSENLQTLESFWADPLRLCLLVFWGTGVAGLAQGLTSQCRW